MTTGCETAIYPDQRSATVVLYSFLKMRNYHGASLQTHAVGRPGLLKDLNTKAVFDVVAESGGASRAVAAARLGLSATSVSRIVDSLLRAGLLREGERLASRIGRRQTLLEVEPSAGTVVAVDVRTKSIRLSAADLRGRRIAQQRIEMTATDASSLLDGVAEEVLRLATVAQSPLTSVVVGLPGAWDQAKQRVYSVPNLSFLEQVDLQGILGERLAVTVVVDNDINFAALGEYHFGAGRGAADLLYLNLGSGIGAGLVVSGKLHRGVNGFAGEVGSLPVREPGGSGFVPLESMISRRSLDVRLAATGFPGGVVRWLADSEGWGEGAPHAIARHIAEHCAVAIAAAICLADPGLVVLGGSIGRYSEALIPLVQHTIGGMLEQVPTIVPTQLREDAALLGATAIGLRSARKTLVEQITGEDIN